MPNPVWLKSPMGVLAGLMAYWGFVDGINGAAAPFLAREFDLDDVGIARAYGWMSVGALATYVLARAADRVGRRRILLVALGLLSPLALASALAPNLVGFVSVQVGVGALKGVLVVVIPVMVAEVLPGGGRARGQSFVGLTGTLGAGSAMILVAACEDLPGSWRWGWVVAVFGILLWPTIRRRLSESVHFEQAAAAGDTERARARDLLNPRYRRRTLASVALGLIFPLAMSATQSWLIYYPVRYLGLEPLVVTGIVIAGGAFALAGFPLGGHLSERWGRRPTFACAATLYVVAAVAFYHVPRDFSPHPGFGLAAAFAAMALLSSTATVPLRAAATELFPTALRATLSGWNAIATAVGVILGYFATATLSALLGSLPAAVSILACSLLPGALIFLLALPESRGLELESAVEVE